MKLKELPRSLWRVWQLKKLNLVDAHKASLDDLPFIVSFTSIPSRLSVVPFTVRSLLAQTRKPEKIILWLHESLSSKIPTELAKMCGQKFEIRYSFLDCPHLKLVESLQVFPECIIVTCDDDLLYDPRCLESLFEEHERFPKAILAHECRLITYDHHKKIKSYSEWKLTRDTPLDHPGVLALGYGCVLYPPHSLSKEVCDSTLYLQLAPKADDLWFKVMSYRQSTVVRKVVTNIERALPIPGSQTVSLKKNNVRFDGNNHQWQALVDYFKLPPFID